MSRYSPRADKKGGRRRREERNGEEFIFARGSSELGDKKCTLAHARMGQIGQRDAARKRQNKGMKKVKSFSERRSRDTESDAKVFSVEEETWEGRE